MKQYIRQWIAWLIMAAGVCLLSGPFIIGFIGEMQQRDVVREFEKELSKAVPVITQSTAAAAPDINNSKRENTEQAETVVSEENESADGEENTASTEMPAPEIELRELTPLELFYLEASEYNDSLVNCNVMNMNSRSDLENFPLKAYNYGVANELIGTIEIPRLNIELGLYLGTSEANMAKGLAVFGHTSVPLGRESENCAIAGHRGWSGTPMLRDIQQLMIDDPIYVKTLWGALEYRVCELLIVTPEDRSWCAIQEGRTLISLMTCHPYGHNYQRYVVFAELCANDENEPEHVERNTVTATVAGSAPEEYELRDLPSVQAVTLVNADGSTEIIEIDTTAISPGAEEYGTGMSNLVIMAEDKMRPVALCSAIFVGAVGIVLLIQTIRSIKTEKGDNHASE